MNQSSQLPADHEARMHRALLSLDGLSVGDGFGECFFSFPNILDRVKRQDPPPPPWIITDDTTMALSIVRCLKRYGHIEQDALAAAFAQEFVREPNRGYGRMAIQILNAIGQGMSWKSVSRQAFGGQGSCGNGGAMRSAPIGAYFADDYDRVIHEANASAEITHAHPDGQAGAVAVALAAAWLCRENRHAEKPSYALIEFVLEHIPQTDTFHSLKKALEVGFELSSLDAALALGNGSRVISSDTVPFCLWCAARHANSYADALWTTVAGLGDIDTTCAIVGGIVALSAGREAIPADWLKAREPIYL